MPTDLPPGYKPKRPDEPADPTAPGEDVPGEAAPQPGPEVGAPGPDADVVDPPGWSEPPITPGESPVLVPTPAGTPTF